MKKKLYLVILSGILFVIGFIFIYSKTVHHEYALHGCYENDDVSFSHISFDISENIYYYDEVDGDSSVHYTGTYEYTYKSNTGKILTGKLKGWTIRTLSDSQMELDTGSKTMSFSRVSDIPILHDDKNVYDSGESPCDWHQKQPLQSYNRNLFIKAVHPKQTNRF